MDNIFTVSYFLKVLHILMVLKIQNKLYYQYLSKNKLFYYIILSLSQNHNNSTVKTWGVSGLDVWILSDLNAAGKKMP